MLDRLLGQSKNRDTSGWHALSTDPPQTIGNKIVHVAGTTPSTQIGNIPSSRVVNY